MQVMFTPLLLAAAIAASAPASAQPPLKVYGPGGPLPAMQEAAATFQEQHGIKVEVVAGPTANWIAAAKGDADLLYSGSEDMMTSFMVGMDGELQVQDVIPLYLRPAAILVRPGNPHRISGFRDLLTAGRKILVVTGSGQNGLWEDVAGRLGSISSVKAFRANVKTFAPNSAVAKQAWTADPTLDAWLIWNIWQVANPQLADEVPLEAEYRIYRDIGVVLTPTGKQRPEAVAFVKFLSSPTGDQIFRKWGWAREFPVSKQETAK
ncbi:substrate-binding domain-containing protein [Sphingomonas sp. BN140010]|uniref:Substrate-binding domain-containing protein n=1 Tax=Sphingomonas arvum TaxID=2992113 RepID=A0ABT3JDQ4_9SPHN|nr:substrate-binding domain-containing protein [Sphingomonas sp. BN140010]MCW3797199.1 substrate-binding domain-containing protein [Sphingomonas sp. BN140010]